MQVEEDLHGLNAELAVMRNVASRVPAMLAYWDSEQRCCFANRAYEEWFGVVPEVLLGTTLNELLGPIYPLNLPYIQGALRGEPQTFEREIPDPRGGPSRHSETNYTPHVVDGVVKGFAVMVFDITRRKRAEDDLRDSNERLFRLNAELQAALDNVRTLSGLLPICAWCKRIRTDEGFYQKIEAFISARTSATFSHGICPACASQVEEEGNR